MRLQHILLIILFLSLSATGYAQSSSELKKRKAALTREIEALKKQQNKIAGNKQLSLKQIEGLNAQIRLREEKISTINNEIRVLDSEIKEKTSTVLSLKDQLRKLKNEYAAMIRFAQKNQNAYNKLMFVFASESFNQAYKRLKYLQEFSEHHKKQAVKIAGTQKVLGIKINELDQNKRSKSSLLRNEEVEKITLSKEKESEAQQLEKFQKEEKQVKQLVDARKKELSRLTRAISNAINREIAAERKRMMAEAARRAAAARAKAEKERLAEKARIAAGKPASPASKSTSTAKAKAAEEAPLASSPAPSAENVKLSADFSSNHGRLPWPVDGSIVSRFGINRYGSVVVQNNGIDIRSSAGANVRAVFSGEVRRVLSDISGHILLIKHGNYFSVYSNLQSVSVSAGQNVSAGQSVGSVKTSVDDGVAQLHFEIWNGNKPTNPQGWLRR